MTDENTQPTPIEQPDAPGEPDIDETAPDPEAEPDDDEDETELRSDGPLRPHRIDDNGQPHQGDAGEV